jgi:type IV pilus assembly protein PilC
MTNLSDREKQIFYHQLVNLLQAGIPLDRAAGLMAEHRPSAGLTEVLNAMASAFRAGRTLSDFVGDHPETFSAYDGEVMAAGEESDDLAGSLHWLAGLYARQMENRRMSRIQSLYMLVASGVGIGVLFVLFLYVIPVFGEMFSGFGSELPAPTQLIMDISRWTVRYWALIPVGMAMAAALLWWLWRQYPETVSLIASHIPWLGRTWMLEEFVRFAMVLGRALEAGVPPLRALPCSADFVVHPYLKSRLKAMGPSIEQGQAWAHALTTIRRLPKVLVAFVRLGEEQGELGASLLELHQTEGALVKHRVQWVNLLPWFVVAVLAFSMGFSIWALYLPVFLMAGSLF